MNIEVRKRKLDINLKKYEKKLTIGILGWYI